MAIEHGATVFTLDHDFSAMVRVADLSLYRG